VEVTVREMAGGPWAHGTARQTASPHATAATATTDSLRRIQMGRTINSPEARVRDVSYPPNLLERRLVTRGRAAMTRARTTIQSRVPTESLSAAPGRSIAPAIRRSGTSHMRATAP
jgi:hypothetical protein